MTDDKKLLTPEEIETYQHDGVICLRNILDQKWIDLLNLGVDRNIENPSKHFGDFTKPGDDARCIRDYWSWENIPEYQDFFKNSPIAQITGELMQAEEIRFLEDQYFQKEPGSVTPSPWHQDQPYYELKGDWCIVWIPLAPCDEDDSLSFAKGTHRSGQLFTPKNFSNDNENYHIDEQSSPLSEMPDVDNGEYDIVSWALELGDMLIFHPRMFHSNIGNTGDRRARRFVCRWITENVTFDEKVFPWATMIEGHSLQHGDLLRGHKFPLIWTREKGMVGA